MKKKFSLLFVFLLFFHTLTSSALGIPSEVTAKDLEKSIFTDVSVTDESGAELTDLNEHPGEKVHVNATWSVEGVDVQAGDTDSLELPEELRIEHEQSGTLTTDNVEIGTYKASTNGKVTVTLNEEVESNTDASGEINIEAIVTGEPATEKQAEGNKENKAKDNAKEQAKQTTSRTMKLTSTEITENIITDVELSQKIGENDFKKLEPGTEIVVDNPYHEFKVKLDYMFALPNNHEYGNGSTYTIEIPEVFSVLANPEPTPLKDEGGTEFASFIVTNDNKIVITFNEEIEENSNVSGYLNLESEFDSHYKGEAETEINFPIEGQGTANYPIKFIPKSTSIDKKGVPADKAYNTETIQWTVDFNKDLQEIKNATLEDVTEGNHTFKDGSLKVYKLSMNADGSINEDKTEEIKNHGFGDKFTLNLGDIDSAYRVVYETSIPTDDKGESYKNKAILDGENVNPVDASATVNVKRGKPLEKRSSKYDAKTQTITWEIKYNYDEKTIVRDKAKLTDIFGENQELVQDSFIVQEISINPETGRESGSEKFTNFTVNPTTDGFEFQFDQDIEKAYKITYQTKAIDRVEGSETIKNKIEDEFNNQEEGSRDIGQQIFHKSHNNNLDYKDKTMSWTLRINSDAYEMAGVKVVDTLPKGFTPRDIVVKHANDTWSKDDEYTWEFDNYKQQLTITFNEPIDEEVIITYTTDIDFNETENNNAFKNNAKLTWVQDGNNGSGEKDGNATYNPDDYTKANGFKGSTYNAKTKEIQWEIGINYNNVKLDNASVEDFILGAQNFDIDSIKVYRMDLKGGWNGVEFSEEVDPEHYDVEAIENDDKEPGFRVKLGDIDSGYVITYTTDLNEQLIEKTYNNKATVKSDNRDSFELKSSVSPYYGGEYTKKEAKQNDDNPRIVNWSVNINFAQSTVDNVSVSDTPSENQMLLPETIKLYDTEVTENSINKGKELTEGEDYTVHIVENNDDTETFTVTFTEKTIDRAYVLEYDTRIMFKGDGYIENDVKFNGTQTEGRDTDNSVRQQIQLSNIGGGIDGEVGSLEVTKVDADDQEPLQGATFELYDENGKLVTTQTTDEDGKVLFTKLLYRDYTLKETNAPEGYVVGITDSQTVKVDADVSKVTIENKKLIGDVELKKIDADTKEALKGVVFELQDKDGVKISQHTTNAEGKITVQELEPGDYFFKEVEAFGYKPLTEKIPFTIAADQTEVLQLDPVENDIILGSVELKKVDADNNNEPLKGVEYKLEDAEGNVIKENLPTNDEGKITVDGLRPATYYFIETKALEHYQLDDTAIKVVVEKAQTEIATVQAENELITGSVELTKRGEDGKFLEGVKFELQDENGNTISEHTTKADGKLTVGDLKPGNYQFKEVATIPGYELNSETKPFEIVKSQETAVTVEFTNDLTTGSVQLKKLGEENEALKGAEFELRDSDDNVIREGLETKENGIIEVEDLKPGTYYFVETKAPFGHELDDTPVEVEVVFNQQETATVTKNNERSTSGVELTKKGEDGVLLDGVVFDLQDQDGNLLQEGLTTKDGGKLIVDDLKPGHYQFVEKETVHGYVLSETAITFEVVLGQTERTTVDVENELQTGAVELTKVDDETGETLQGAVFELQDQDGNLLQDGLTTKKEGNISVDNLKPGDYQFVEVESPEGYHIGTDPIPFTIDKGQSETLKITTDNSIIKGDFILTKVDFDNETLLLEDVEFELQDAAGNVLDNDLVTNQEGKLEINDLRPGTYTLIETKPLFGYESQEPIQFTINKGQLEAKEITLTNKLIRGSVALTKVDADNQKIVLEGAQFKLMDANGNTLQEGLTTNKDGTFEVSNLKPGDYTFIETKAPNGYELDETPIPFTIEKGQNEAKKVIVENAKQVEEGSSGFNLPKTATDLFNLMLVGVGLLLVGLVILFVRRKKEI